MANVEQLLSEYIAEHRAGGKADPLEYLGRVEGTDRAELIELIDAYLERSPGREWDAGAYQGSDAERVADAITRSLVGASGWWPVVLPRLRDRARLTRAQVVERLSAALGAVGSEQKVGAYYHEMEHGSLASRGVSQRVLDALGGIYGAGADYLREAGEPIGSGRGPTSVPAMARVAIPDAAYETLDAPAAAPRSEPVTPAEERDEIDELFTGGL
jgi:hypothetical protein